MSTSSNNIFNEDDLKSNDGMLTSIWGPMLWIFLHIISFNYPVQPTPEMQKNYKQFFDSLQFILPCSYCRDNLPHNYQATSYGPSVFENRFTLSRWVYNLHQHVNQMLHKSFTLSYEEIQQKYENFRARCGLQNKKNIKEKGCTQPIRGKKSKCILNIIPYTDSRHGLYINKQCLCKTMKKTKTTPTH